MRLSLIRLWAFVFVRAARFPGALCVFRALRSSRLGRFVSDRLLGYHRLFASLAEAEACANRYWPASHASPANLSNQHRFIARPRLSDYPVLFQLSRITGEVRLFDLGGNVGNLFYCYRNYLDLGRNFKWIVFDLPQTLEKGQALAAAQPNTEGLAFVDDFAAADGVDVFLASGSLHYFEDSLPAMLSRLRSRPPHVMLNRTPLTYGPTSVTVQDAGTVMHGCKLFNVNEIIEGMMELGYRMVDDWHVPDLNLRIPLYPDRSAPYYSGMCFRLNE
jgi:putative methyltransferase (TIGR04325 family)